MTQAELDQRVLVLAPAGRDAALAARALEQAGISAVPCQDMPCFVAELARGAAAAVVTEEALAPASRAQLRDCLEEQPLWSDFPIIVCAAPSASASGRNRLAQLAGELGNASIVTR